MMSNQRRLRVTELRFKARSMTAAECRLLNQAQASILVGSFSLVKKLPLPLAK